MMMLKMMNPFGSVTDSIPGVGGGKSEEDEVSKEDQVEQERLRQEAIKQAEKERRDKYRKQEEEREHLRQGIRDKYGIEKKIDPDEEEDDEDEEGFGSAAKKEEDEDPVMQAKALAEKQMNELKGQIEGKCILQ